MDELDKCCDEEIKLRRLVQLNATGFALTVLKNVTVQMGQNQTHLPMVRARVYDLETGVINRLSVDLSKAIKNMASIYIN